MDAGKLHLLPRKRESSGKFFPFPEIFTINEQAVYVYSFLLHSAQNAAVPLLYIVNHKIERLINSGTVIGDFNFESERKVGILSKFVSLSVLLIILRVHVLPKCSTLDHSPDL